VVKRLENVSFTFFFFAILLLDTILEGLGKGSEALVFKVQNSANKLFAMKRFGIDTKGSIQVNDERIRNEVAIGMNPNLNSKHLMRYLDFFKSDGHYYVIMELCKTSDLADQIKKLMEGKVVFNEDV
jgi:serine/threonine protein kinase